MKNQQKQFMIPQNATHCPSCGRCFCGVAKTSTSDGKPICVKCKAAYEAKIAKQQQ